MTDVDAFVAALPKKDLVEQTTTRTVLEMDETSEVHRFVGSGISKRRCKWYKKLKECRWKQRNAKLGSHEWKKHESKAKHWEKLIALSNQVGCLREHLPEKLDDKYYNSYMKAHNRGGWILVRPEFFYWGKTVLQVIRAAIRKETIKKLGKHAQEKAAKLVLESKEITTFFEKSFDQVSDRAATQNDSKVMAEFICEVVNYAFHARSGEIWRQVKAETTDRTVAASKKMGRREVLKHGRRAKPKKEK